MRVSFRRVKGLTLQVYHRFVIVSVVSGVVLPNLVDVEACYVVEHTGMVRVDG